MNQMMLLLAMALLTLLFVFISVLIICYCFENTFLAARKTPEEAFELLEKRGVYARGDYESLDFEEIKTVSEDGYMLSGQYLSLWPQSEKVVILIHGYTANHFMKLQFVNMYKTLGYNILMIDARSHGRSGGLYPTYGIREASDLKKWVEALKKKLGQNIKIGMHGQSMGASSALMYSGQYEEVTFVIADCPYASAKEVLMYQYKTIGHMPPNTLYRIIRKLAEKKCGINLDLASPIDYIKESATPILFIHGKRDRIIPSAMSEKMYEVRNNSRDRLLIVEEANHVESYMLAKEQYEEAVVEFIQRHRPTHNI